MKGFFALQSSAYQEPENGVEKQQCRQNYSTAVRPPVKALFFSEPPLFIKRGKNSPLLEKKEAWADALSALRKPDFLEDSIEIIQGKILDLNTPLFLIFSRINLCLGSEKMRQSRFKINDFRA